MTSRMRHLPPCNTYLGCPVNSVPKARPYATCYSILPNSADGTTSSPLHQQYWPNQVDDEQQGPGKRCPQEVVDVTTRTSRPLSQFQLANSSKSWHNKDLHLTSTITYKLEVGNFQATIRMLCSEDKPALKNTETLEVLKHYQAAQNRKPAYDFVGNTRFQPLQVS